MFDKCLILCLKLYLIINNNKCNKFTNELTFTPASLGNVKKKPINLDLLESSSSTSIPATTLK